jgi:hypothetical protein
VPNEDEVEVGTADLLVTIRALVAAHDVPDPRRGGRAPIWYLRYHGDVMHHALEAGSKPHLDEALIDELHGAGLISLEYGGNDGNTWKLTPTGKARTILAEEDRMNDEPAADVGPIVEALDRQAEAANPVAWPAVRLILDALSGYWRASGYPSTGVPLLAIARKLEPTRVPLFGLATRELVSGGYLARGYLGGEIGDDHGRQTSFPGEVALTEKAHTALHGWPGASPDQVVENLLAVLGEAAESESNPARKRRLEALAAAVKDVGVSVTAEVIARAVTG